METPPNLTFPQVTALFGDSSYEQQRQELLNNFPLNYPNKFENSSDRNQAASSTSEERDFRTEEFVEGARIFNGRLQYPYTSVAELWTTKTDPFYYDGSEANSSFNLQENLIGRPLGSDLLQDPNLTYVENLLQIQQHRGEQSVLNDDYIKELYAFNSAKGNNYYLNQIEKNNEQLATITRDERARKQSENSFSISQQNEDQSVPHGVFEHQRRIDRGLMYLPSANAFQQGNARQARFDRISAMSNSPIEPSTVMEPSLEKDHPSREPDTSKEKNREIKRLQRRYLRHRKITKGESEKTKKLEEQLALLAGSSQINES